MIEMNQERLLKSNKLLEEQLVKQKMEHAEKEQIMRDALAELKK